MTYRKKCEKPPEPINQRLQNENWFCRKQDKIQQLIEASEGIFFAFLNTKNMKKNVFPEFFFLKIFR